MSNLVQKVASYGTSKRIMIGQDSHYLALGCIVEGTANTILKAGEPLVGNIAKRDTAFTAGTEGAVGMNLHDVKFDADGKANATLVIVGCVDALKIDKEVRGRLEAAKPAGIIVVEGSEF